MAIKSQRTITQATVTGAASIEGIIRALEKLPKDAIVTEAWVEEDYTADDRPGAFTFEVQWRVM